MVARNEHYLQAPHGLRGAEQEIVKEFLGTCRRVGGIKHVACHDEHIGLLLFHHLQEPAEEMAVFVRTVVAVEIVAEVPESEMTTFSTSMRQITQGRGSFTTEFSRYERCPEHIAQKVIAESSVED